MPTCRCCAKQALEEKKMNIHCLWCLLCTWNVSSRLTSFNHFSVAPSLAIVSWPLLRLCWVLLKPDAFLCVCSFPSLTAQSKECCEKGKWWMMVVRSGWQKIRNVNPSINTDKRKEASTCTTTHFLMIWQDNLSWAKHEGHFSVWQAISLDTALLVL